MPKAESMSFDSTVFYEILRNGGVSSKQALKNTAVLRCVDLIAGTMGSLPLYLKRQDASGGIVNAENHPLFDVFDYRPNNWQNPFQFKQQMQFWALFYGNAYALISRRNNQVISLNPIHPNRVNLEQLPDFSLEYRVTGKNNEYKVIDSRDIIHIRFLSEDGYSGLSPVKQAADVINIAVMSQTAAKRTYDHGMQVGGVIKHPGKLGLEGRKNLILSMESRHAGAENANKTMVLDEGMDFTALQSTAVDSQLVEMRASLVEEIGRVFGVPRPLLGVDDTSWGTGIEQLAILFVRFGLRPWMTCWESEIKLKCLNRDERKTLYPDFDEKELLRGTVKDQFEAFAKASGAGGHKPWMEANEIRDLMGEAPHPDGFGLKAAGEVSGSRLDQESLDNAESALSQMMKGLKEGLQDVH